MRWFFKFAHDPGVEYPDEVEIEPCAIDGHVYSAPRPECKHLNLRIVGSNSPGKPFECLDCGAKHLQWGALNGLLEELNKLVSNRK